MESDQILPIFEPFFGGGLMLVHHPGQQIETNRQWRELFWFQGNDISEWLHYIVPEDRDRIIEAWNLFRQEISITGDSGKFPEFCCEFRIVTFEEECHVLLKVRFVRTENHVLEMYQVDKLNKTPFVSSGNNLFLRNFINTAPMAICARSNTGKFILANRLYLIEMGFKPNENILGKTLSQIIEEGNAAHLLETEEDDQWVLEKNVPLTTETMIQDEDDDMDLFGDNRVFYMNHRFPLFGPSGETLGVGLIRTNVTEAKLLQEKTENELKQARINAEKISASKTSFLSSMSHEIRTPLNAISGFCGIILDQMQEVEIPAEMKQYLRNIHGASRTLAELVNNILDLAKIEAGKMSISEENLNLKALIQGIYHINKFKALEKQILFSFSYNASLPEVIYSDRTKINQILLNLTSNALKFTPQGKSVRIEVLADDDSHLLIQVADEGIGIPENRLDAVFGEFEQANTSTARNYGGTGLGLAITKRMVELMQGEISIQSTVGQGSLFTVRLPLRHSEGTAIAMELETNLVKFSGENRVLLVEDNPLNQEMMVALFKNMGMDLHVCGNGQEGILKTDELMPDLVLMDIDMPVMDGITATLKIREKYQDLPIIGISANAFKSQKMNALRAGMNEYLTKPVDSHQLSLLLGHYLKIETDTPPKNHPCASESDNVRILKEMEKLAQVSIFETEKLMDQILLITELCEPVIQQLNPFLKKLEKAALVANESLLEKALNEIKQQLMRGNGGEYGGYSDS
ncbi:MAG: response regulator [SAR324 cluster bacterium]|nr:response regulator [SAR324 cluster bacterium]